MHNLSRMDGLVLTAWLVFVVYWFVSAGNVKRDVDGGTGRRGRSLSLVRIIAALALTYYFPTIITRLFGTSILSPRDVALRETGLVFTVSGVAFAIWARSHLGRNWSGHPALKEDHELVTTGPYGFLRHPIYTGMLAAGLGSMFATLEAFWLYFFVLMRITFVYRIHGEEGIMMRTFPDSYPAYRDRMNALIPFIW